MKTNMTKKVTEGPQSAISQKYDLDKPAEAVQMAVLLKNIIVQQKLYVNIKGRNYAMVDAWVMAGFLTGISVMVDEPKNLSNEKEIKYSVTAKLYKGDQQIGAGYALASSKEAIKRNFDEYAIYSLAQTRAIGKAYRNKIGFLIKLAGMETTPAEEITKVSEQTPASGVESSIEKLRSSKTLVELENAWKSLTSKQRADDEIAAVKDELKKTLQ